MSITQTFVQTGSDVKNDRLGTFPALAPDLFDTFDVTLSGLGGNDTLSAYSGPADWVAYAEALPEGSVTLTITNHLTGGAGRDWLESSQAPSVNSPAFWAVSRSDTLDGGDGNDTYVLHGDAVIILDNAGIDTVILAADYAEQTHWVPFDLADNAMDVIENLTALGVMDIHLFGNDLNNTITGNGGHNVLMGGLGADVLYGGEGQDALLGGDGNDALYGGEGEDNMLGGRGSDRYIVDSYGDLIVDDEGSEVDTVSSSNIGLEGDFYEGVEILRLTGTEDLYIAGGLYATKLFGNAGHNQILMFDRETAYGGDGNDSFFDDALGGSATAFGGNGNDLFSFDIGKNRLTGNAGEDYFDIQPSRLNMATAPSNAMALTITDFEFGTDHINFANGVSSASTDPLAADGHCNVKLSYLTQVSPKGETHILQLDADIDGNGVADVRVMLLVAPGFILDPLDYGDVFALAPSILA